MLGSELLTESNAFSSNTNQTTLSKFRNWRPAEPQLACLHLLQTESLFHEEVQPNPRSQQPWKCSTHLKPTQHNFSQSLSIPILRLTSKRHTLLLAHLSSTTRNKCIARRRTAELGQKATMKTTEGFEEKESSHKCRERISSKISQNGDMRRALDP